MRNLALACNLGLLAGAKRRRRAKPAGAGAIDVTRMRRANGGYGAAKQSGCV